MHGFAHILMILVLPLLALDAAQACTRTRPIPPPEIWDLKPLLRVGIEVDVPFPPDQLTTCIVGIGIGGPGQPLPATLDVIGAHMTITNIHTLQTVDLAQFVFARDPMWDLPLANGNNGPIVGQPIFPGATWFGFSAQVQPFVPPALGPDEVFGLWFDITVSGDDYNLMKNNGYLGQFAAGSNDVAHPVVYFTAANPALVSEPALPWLLALAGLVLALRRHHPPPLART